MPKMNEVLVPDRATIDKYLAAAHHQEHPRPNPFAVHQGKVLTNAECEKMISLGMGLEETGMPHCGARIRPIHHTIFPSAIFEKVMRSFGSHGDWWDFDIDNVSFALMAYDVDGDYQWHVDIQPGTSRKLSASLLLNEDYDGGDLIIRTVEDFTMPKATGTLVTFPAYMLHTVTPVTRGTRYSLVIASWGEPFR